MFPGSSLGHLSMLLASSGAVPYGILVAGIFAWSHACGGARRERAPRRANQLRTASSLRLLSDFATSALKLQANPRKLVASATGKKLLGRDPARFCRPSQRLNRIFDLNSSRLGRLW